MSTRRSRECCGRDQTSCEQALRPEQPRLCNPSCCRGSCSSAGRFSSKSVPAHNSGNVRLDPPNCPRPWCSLANTGRGKIRCTRCRLREESFPTKFSPAVFEKSCTQPREVPLACSPKNSLPPRWVCVRIQPYGPVGHKEPKDETRAIGLRGGASGHCDGCRREHHR